MGATNGTNGVPNGTNGAAAGNESNGVKTEWSILGIEY